MPAGFPDLAGDQHGRFFGRPILVAARLRAANLDPRPLGLGLPPRDSAVSPYDQFRTGEPAAYRSDARGRRRGWARALELGGDLYCRRLLPKDLPYRLSPIADRHLPTALYNAFSGGDCRRSRFAVRHAKPRGRARQHGGSASASTTAPMGAGNRLPRSVAADPLLQPLISYSGYVVIQLGIAAAAAAICMARWRAGRPRLEVLSTADGPCSVLDDDLRSDHRGQRLHPPGLPTLAFTFLECWHTPRPYWVSTLVGRAPRPLPRPF